MGVGSLAAGSAAAMGTGAFTSVTADRGVEVNVTGDASAYLGLTPSDGPNGVYAEDNSDELVVKFNDIDDGNSSAEDGNEGSGNGVNPNAVTTADSVFTITNQGTQAVDVTLDDSGLPDGLSASLPSSTVTLTVGDSVDVSFDINTADHDPSAGGTLTIKANA